MRFGLYGLCAYSAQWSNLSANGELPDLRKSSPPLWAASAVASGPSAMCVQKGIQGGLASIGFWNLTFFYEMFGKSLCLSFEWEKRNFTTFAPPPGKIHHWPSGKNPSGAHAQRIDLATPGDSRAGTKCGLLTTWKFKSPKSSPGLVARWGRVISVFNLSQASNSPVIMFPADALFHYNLWKKAKNMKSTKCAVLEMRALLATCVFTKFSILTQPVARIRYGLIPGLHANKDLRTAR